MANKRSISTMRPTPSEKQRGPQSLPLRMENFGGAGKPESSKHFNAEIAAFASLWSVIFRKRGLVFNSLTFSCYLASIFCKNAEMPHFRAAFLLCIFFINTFWSEMGDSNSRPDGPKPPALPTALYPDIRFFCMILCGEGKSKFFVSVGSAVVKAGFAGGSSGGGFPPQATVPRTSGLSLLGEWIDRLSSQSRRATNCATPGYEVVGWPGRILPNQARYQLRYTRIFDFGPL